MKTCFCDTCTCNGLRPQGSLQSVTTAQEHQCSQIIKDRLAHALTDALTTTDFRGQLEPSNQDASGQVHLLRAIPGTDCRNNKILTHIRHRVSSFQFPPRLVFAHPPATPHSIYVSDAGPWEQGPHALAVMAPENADILQHVQFLQRTNRILRLSVSDSVLWLATLAALSNLLSLELSRMETFRKNAWDDQLVSLPSSSHRPYSSPSPAWQPIHYDVGKSLPTPCRMSPFNMGWLQNRAPHQR